MDEYKILPSLYEIQERNRQRALYRVMATLRLPTEKSDALREVFDRVLVHLRHEIRVQVGTILSERFEFDALDEHLQEFAASIGKLVNGQRVDEELAEARRIAGTVLSAAIGGAIGDRERP